MTHPTPTGLSAGFSRRALVPVTVLLVAACGDSVPGPQGESCGPPPYFTVLPAAGSDIDFVAAFGGPGAPGHTLPRASPVG